MLAQARAEGKSALEIARFYEEAFHRDLSDLNLRLGEFYLDVEDLSHLWGRDRQLNLRVGRVDVPFGEEGTEVVSGTTDCTTGAVSSHESPAMFTLTEATISSGQVGQASSFAPMA